MPIIRTLFIATLLCLVSSFGRSMFTTPERPLKMAVTFKSVSSTTGILSVKLTSEDVIGKATISFELPKGVSVSTKERDVKRQENVFFIQEGKKESRAYEFEIRIDNAEMNEINIRAESTPDEKTRHQDHKRYFIQRGNRAVRFLTPTQRMREMRIDAEKKVKELQQKDPGANTNTVLGGKAVELAPDKLQKIERQKFDDRIPMLTPSEREEWEKQYYRPRPKDKDIDPITVRGTLYFEDIGGSLRPLVNASLYIMDSDNGPDDEVAVTITDWSGRFSASVNNDDGWWQDGRDIYVEIKTTNTRFRVQDESYWPDWTYTWRMDDGNNLDDGAVVDFGSRYLADYKGAAIVFQKMNDAWNHFTGTGGQDPGFIDGSYPTDDTHYDPFWGEVNITGADDDSRDIIVHEYGHGLMDNAQSSDSWSGASHSFCQLTTTGQAFDEGWATFVCLAVYPDNRFNWEPNDGGRELELYNCSTSQSNSNGPRDEGRVAAALLDLIDIANDSLYGCTSLGDDNRFTRVPLRTIWRDALWGSSGSTVNSMTSFWNRLCPRLTDAQRAPATTIMNFNCFNVTECDPEPLYVAQQISETERRREGLRMVEREMRKFEAGRNLIDFYYDNVEVLTIASTRDVKMRSLAKDIVAGLVALSLALIDDTHSKDKEVIFDQQFAPALRTFMMNAAADPDKEASVRLRNDLDRLKFDTVVSDFEGRSVAEIRAKFVNMKQP